LIQQKNIDAEVSKLYSSANQNWKQH